MGRFMGPTSAMSFSSEGEPMASSRKLDLQSSIRCSVTEPVALVWGRALSTAQAERSSAAPCGHSNSAFASVLVLLLSGFFAWLPGSLFAQSPSAGQNPSGEPEGVTSGGYLIHSSVELGYRSNNVTGS